MMHASVYVDIYQVNILIIFIYIYIYISKKKKKLYFFFRTKLYIDVLCHRFLYVCSCKYVMHLKSRIGYLNKLIISQ